MVKFSALGFATGILAATALLPLSFSFLPQASLSNRYRRHVAVTDLCTLKAHSEFRILEDDEDDEASVPGKPTGDFFAVDNRGIVSPDPFAEDDSVGRSDRPRPQYGALAPGTVVQVQVGDVSLARKAWKKRRRTGSPLLIPCSVLNVDHQSMVRWNLIHLLEKFGQSRKDGLELSGPQLSRKYRTYLKTSLQQQAESLGYESARDLIVALFNKKAQESYGVRLTEEEGEDGLIFLKAPISRTKAQKLAAAAPMLQFREFQPGDHGDSDTLTHTGKIRAKNEDGEYAYPDLSAALRVSQKDDLDSGRVEQHNIHPAVIYDYDPIGDSGSPLLTLSLNPRGVREGMKIKPDKKYTPIEHPEHFLEELSVGDGPYRARVVQLVPGKALVDFEVGRKVSSQGMVKVLGSLRFQDSVELVNDVTTHFSQLPVDHGTSDVIEDVLADFEDEDEDDEEEDDGTIDELFSLRSESSFEEGTFEDGEEEEDISDLFKMNQDGSLTYMDPDSGESHVIDTGDEDLQEMRKVQSLISSHKPKPKPKKRAKKVEKSKSPAPFHEPRFKSKRLRVGDFVDVYVRSVSKQSSQLTVTTNPLVQGRTAKEIKKEGDAEKKLKKLKKSLGGSLKRIWELEGQECAGIVKATSNTGHWVYVKPELSDLPVGIAALEEGTEDALCVGDNVQVQIAGVDEQRGQLSMKYIGKLSP